MAENVECPSCQHTWPATEADLGLQKCPACNADIEVYEENTMAENVECPNCQHSWPATEADLGLQSCPGCGIALEVTRQPLVWSYAAVTVTAADT